MQTVEQTAEGTWMDYQRIKSLGGSRWSDLELPELLERLPSRKTSNGEEYLINESSMSTFLPYQAA